VFEWRFAQHRRACDQCVFTCISAAKFCRSHQPINSFMVHSRLTGLAELAVEQSSNSSVPVGRPFVDELANEGSSHSSSGLTYVERVFAASSRRSIRFDRDTANVSQIVFTANLPPEAMANAISVFLLREFDGLAQNLDF
jgi:hypothetical protein